MFRFYRFSCIVASIFFLVCSLEIPTCEKGKLPSWYSEHVWFSDWRGKPAPDCATNVAVCLYYTHFTGGGMRMADREKIRSRLLQGDTLLVAVDYYALFPLSSFFFPDGLLAHYRQRLYEGEVLYFTVRMENGRVVYTEMRK